MKSVRAALDYFAELRKALPQAKQAKDDQSVSSVRQVCEMVALRLGRGKLSPTDYYMLRLYRKDIPFAEKRTYLSDRSMGSFRRDKNWDLVAHDKVLTYGILSFHGIAVPKTVAIIHPSRKFGSAKPLKCAEELEAYLRYEAPYPIFSKPITGIFSRDAMILNALDQEQNVLVLGDGSHLPLKDYLALCSRGTSGYLLQELLHPHPDIRSLCGDRVCTVRMIVFYRRRSVEARLHCALWKVAAPENMADNYWRQGNMLALLDPQDGRVERCTSGLGKDIRVVERHPVSGRPMCGFRLPDWERAVALTMDAAHAFPGLPVQAWDIALTSEGPVALEVNIFGSLFLPQIATQSGLYRGEFRDFMESQVR